MGTGGSALIPVVQKRVFRAPANLYKFEHVLFNLVNAPTT